MSAPDAPADNSLAVAQMQQQASDKAAAQAKADAAQKIIDLTNLRNSSRDSARNSVNTYFTNSGLDPTKYGSDIDQQLQDILGGIAPTDENPGSYFKTAGQDILGNLTKQAQMKDSSALDQVFNPNYSSTRINSTIDDPILASILGEQRTSADQIIQNMLKRGVLTDTGASGAEADLDRQAAGVKTKLQSFGDATVAGGQQKLDDVINKARSDAGTIKLGQSFDPSQYVGNADQVYNDFVSSLGDQIRSKVSGNLFQTNGLAAIGGAAQGAGNTAYNPNAAAGVIDPTDTTDPNKAPAKESIF